MALNKILLASFAMAACAAATPAPAQSIEDLQTRLQRVERDVRDVELDLYRRKNADKNPVELGIVTNDQLQPVTNRVAEMEESLTRLTGQIEELSHTLDQLSQKLDRLQKDTDFRLNNLTANQGAGTVDGDLPPIGQTGAGAPGPASAGATLGTLPANSPARPASGGNTQAEFDAAMNQLAKAQYDTALVSFRSFADAHPNDALASQALYWTGDIAYSAKKDYADAARAFAELLKKYAKAPRAPEAMLKLGLSLLSLNQKQEGCATLAALDAKYPNATAAISNRARAERKTARCG